MKKSKKSHTKEPVNDDKLKVERIREGREVYYVAVKNNTELGWGKTANEALFSAATLMSARIRFLELKLADIDQARKTARQLLGLS